MVSSVQASWTLAEALALGRGMERSFRCHVHDDSNASASVNVGKGLWFCYACGARGKVDSDRAPSDEELRSMLEPEKVGRRFPDLFTLTYGVGGYWADRFPLWLCWALGFGEDPWTGEGTYPVHTADGKLAGMARRVSNPEHGTRYRYPPNWSAAKTLFGTRGTWGHQPVLVLTEGAADAAACWEVGVPAVAVFGSGVHFPQIELIEAMRPKAIVLGFDMDDAGQRANDSALDQLAHIAPMSRAMWTAKDPADTDVELRLGIIFDALDDCAKQVWGHTEELYDQIRANDLIAHLMHAYRDRDDAE